MPPIVLLVVVTPEAVAPSQVARSSWRSLAAAIPLTRRAVKSASTVVVRSYASANSRSSDVLPLSVSHWNRASLVGSPERASVAVVLSADRLTGSR